MPTRHWLRILLMSLVVSFSLTACRKEVIRSVVTPVVGTVQVTGTVRDANGPVAGAQIHAVYQFQRDAAPAEAIPPPRHLNVDHVESTMDTVLISRGDFIPLDGRVHVFFSTLKEVQLAHFEIRRDGEQIATWPATNTLTCHMYPMIDDHPLVNGQSYLYTIISLARSGQRWVDSIPGVVPMPQPRMVTQFCLDQSFPNPVQDSVWIGYDLCRTGMVWLGIYDLSGRMVVSMADSVSSGVGSHLRSCSMNSLPNGMYTYRLKICDGYQAQKTLLRNVTNYNSLRYVPGAAVTDSSGAFSMSLAAGATIPMRDAGNQDLGSKPLNAAAIVAFKPGYSYSDTTLDLAGEPPFSIQLNLRSEP
jgi:hypothetical protein